MRQQLLAAAAVLTAAAAPVAQGPSPARLLADVNSQPLVEPSSRPADFVRFGVWTWFTADGEGVGRELYRTQGTAVSTSLLADLRAGPEGSDPVALTVVGNRLYFLADDGVTGREPWVSDGTPAGTRPVGDIVPGAGGFALSGDRGFAVGNRFVFFADDGTAGTEPWVSDGTPAGTQRLADIATGPGGSIAGFDDDLRISHADGSGTPVVDFVARPEPFALELWRSDGTPGGTRSIARVGQSSGTLLGRPIATGSGTIAFVRWNLIMNQHEIWASDGTTAGTGPIGSGDGVRSWLVEPIAFDGRAWFGAADRVADVSDGTMAGTTSVSFSGGTRPTSTQFVGVTGNSLWLTGTRSGETVFMRIDAGTDVAVEVATAPFLTQASVATQPRPAGVAGFRLVVQAIQSPFLWGFDTLTGTASPIANAGAPPYVASLNRVYFPLQSGTGIGIEPGVSDGTPIGTGVLADLRTTASQNRTSSSGPVDYTPFGNRVVFSARGDGTGLEPWISDGTEVGTRLLADLAPDSLSSLPRGYTVAGDRLFFTAQTQLGRELYVSDGTTSGTRRVGDLAPGPAQGVFEDPVAFGREVLFLGDDGSGLGVFVSDGTTTTRIGGIRSTIGTRPTFASLGERVVYRSETSLMPGSRIAADLIVTDGTSAGTSAIANIVYGTLSARVAPIAHAGRVWFFAEDPNTPNNPVLWSSDGTAAGTQVFADLTRTTNEASGARLIAAGDRLYVISGTGLWAIDVDTANVVEIWQLGPRLGVPFATALGNRLLFDVTDNTMVEPWITDGTRAGTERLAPISLSFRGVRGFFVSGVERAFFAAATNPFSGSDELWITDGTPAGTQRFQQLAVEALPTDGALANGRLFLTVLDSDFGREPYVLDPGASVETLGTGCGRGRAPSLRASADPKLGSFVDLIGSAATQGTTAGILLSPPPSRPTPVGTASRCVLQIDIGGFAEIGPLAVQNGAFEVTLPIPDLPVLAGLGVVFQAYVAPTDGALSADWTNGLELTLGR